MHGVFFRVIGPRARRTIGVAAFWLFAPVQMAVAGPNDCNENGIPDDQEIAAVSTFTAMSVQLSPFGAGFTQSFDPPATPVADGPVQLLFMAVADLNSGNADVTLFIDGQDLGEILNGADDCSAPPDEHKLTLPTAQWNALAADGSVHIELVPSNGVNAFECAPTTWVSVTVTYPIVPFNDLDQNGQLDVCQSLRDPDTAALTQPGLAVSYFGLSTPTSLPDFGPLTPLGTGCVPALDFPASNGAFAGSGLTDNLGAAFTGYVMVPAPGFYTFFLNSNDGSRLFIGAQLVVDNDGLHAMVEESGSIGLKAGAHAMRVEFFDRTGAAGLIASIAGGGLTKQVIPPAMLSQGGGCAGDATGDGAVNVQDMVAIIIGWGSCVADPCNADLNDDGMVDVEDLVEVVTGWGPCPPEIWIKSVTLSPNPVDPTDLVTVSITLCNSGPSAEADVTVDVEGGEEGLQPGVLVDPGCETVVEVVIAAPVLEGGCGQPVPRNLNVFVDPEGPDANPDNNAVAVVLNVIPLYSDLHFEVDAQSTACWNQVIDIKIEVTNTGNAPSEAVLGRTGICVSDCDFWGQNCVFSTPSVQTFNIPSIGPGDTWCTIRNYWIGGGICPLLNQYVKAGIDEFNGSEDPCSGGNCEADPITLFCGGCPLPVNLNCP